MPDSKQIERCLATTNIVVLCLIFSSTFGSTTSNADFQEEFSGLLQWKPSVHTLTPSFTSSWFQETVSETALDTISQDLTRQALFSNRNKAHMKAVNTVLDVLMEQETFIDVLKVAQGLRDHTQMNPKLWIQAVISAKLLRPDMQFLKLPSLIEIMPDDFFPMEIFDQAAQSQQQNMLNAQEECLILDERFTSGNGEENGMWHFREDLFVNSHHWYWHIYHSGLGFPRGSHADRRGELFAFMHHDLLARHGAERVTRGLPQIKPLSYDYVTPMEGYNSHLTDRNSGLDWFPRDPNTKLTDIATKVSPEEWRNRTISSIKDLLDRIVYDVGAGYLIDVDETRVPLDTFAGIDILSDTVESSSRAINPKRYSSGSSDSGFHNDGHGVIAKVSNPIQPDPDLGAKLGVMGSTSTSMRDPIFYRHHLAVENIFLQHKNTLAPYSPDGSEYPLKWSAVRILDFQVKPEPAHIALNRLETFWNYKAFNFTRGLDFQRNSTSFPVSICAKHLDHVEFDYILDLNFISEPNVTDDSNATVRIYLARRFDEHGNRYTMKEQHTMFFTLDQFPVSLHSGINRITRNSRNSSLTIPFDAWLGLKDSDKLLQNCGCGWPHHLLLPIGLADFDLFAVVTKEEMKFSYGEDQDGCRVAPLWCGLRGETYPSGYPMGYPFDRPPYSSVVDKLTGTERAVVYLEEYVHGIPNMVAKQIYIQHNGTQRK